MTVDELIERLTLLSEDGAGRYDVVVRDYCGDAITAEGTEADDYGGYVEIY